MNTTFNDSDNDDDDDEHDKSIRKWSDPSRRIATVAVFSRIDNTIATLRRVIIDSLRYVV